MFELERLPDGVKYKYGSKGKWTTIDQNKADKMRENSRGLLYRVTISDVQDIYRGLQALQMDARLMKLKVVRGMVVEQVYEQKQLELPPEDDDEEAEE